MNRNLNLLVIKVAPLVVTHVSLGSERLPAALNAALEGALILVNPHVNCEILFLAESLLTAWECTLEWLRPVVELQVLQQL